MTFRKLQMKIINKWRFILFIILMFTTLLITLVAQGQNFPAFRLYFATSSTLYNVSFTSHENASSLNQNLTLPVSNDMMKTSALMTSSSTEVHTSSITSVYTSWSTTQSQMSSRADVKNMTHKECDKNVKLVSAFFNIGDHQKGGGKRNMAEYFEWSKAFGFIWNPLYFYTDSPIFAEHLKKVRSSINDSLTHIFHINRTSLWPFELRDTIALLYQDSRYPKHHPNTVVPEYTCSMHSKYACMQNAIKNQLEEVNTTYYAWIDIGYFRSLHDKRDYCISVPTGYNNDKVMFNQVYNPNFDLTPKQIHYGNHVWVGGGMFFAERDTMLRFCSEYRRAVEFFLFSRNLSSTDQQCLYSSYTKSGRQDVNLTVELQTLEANGNWFKLGMSSLRRIDLLQH